MHGMATSGSGALGISCPFSWTHQTCAAAGALGTGLRTSWSDAGHGNGVHWDEGKHPVCQCSHLSWAVRSVWGENAFTPCLGPEMAKLARVCKTARDTLASPHLVGIVLKTEKDRECERVCAHECMWRRSSTACLPLPLPPFLCRGFRSSAFHRHWKLGGKLKPDCDWKLM